MANGAASALVSDLPSFSAEAAGFASGETSPRDLLERHLARIEAAEPTVRAFVAHDAAAAIEQADASARRWREGRPLSLIDGMTFGVKDIIATRDFPTRMNSPLFADATPGVDAACVRALREGGAIVLGKTVTTEFAIGVSGPTVNPHDPGRTPGGSSSGSAAGVAAGMIAAGFGTQTQGSTIRPAGFCGVVGFKPTHRLLSVQGVHPLSELLDHLGVIADDVEDAWRVARWVAERAPGPADQGMAGPVDRPLDPLPLDRVALVRTRGLDELDAPSAAAFERCRQELECAGVEVVEPQADPRLAEIMRAFETAPDASLDLLAFEMRWPYLGYRAQDPAALGERIRELLDRGEALEARVYFEQRRRRAEMRARVAALVDDYDAFVLPSSSGVAPEGLAYTGSRTNLVYWTHIGFPAFSLPVMTVEHLPFGLQLAGFAHQDHRLARQAAWLVRRLAR